MDLCDFCAVDLQQLLRAGKISALEILDSYLARIEQVDGCPGSLEAAESAIKSADKVHAFITLDGERARQQAINVDKKLADGEDPGILAGVPFTVKDIFCVENTRTTAASRILANFISPYSATSVARMEAAGALNLGKVNLDEFVFGSSSESSAFQPCTRNPWSLDRVAGGSSGGSAASVAAGEALVSLGTDTAGSIRQPAAFCGVVGLKPTYGRVSRYGVIAFGSSLDCPGAIGKSVRDTAMAYQCMAGSDVHDVTTVTLEVGKDLLLSLEKDIRGLRIGLSPDYFRITYPNPETGEYEEKPIPPEIKEKINTAAKVFSDLGAEIIEDVPLPNTRYGIPAFFVISRVEAASNLHRYDGVKYGYRTPNKYNGLTDLYRKTRGEGFGYQPKLRILMGMYVSAAQYSEQYYQRALRVRTLIRRDFDQIFDPNGAYRLDALLTPTTPTTAFKLGAVYGDSVMMQYADQLTVAANHAGVPAISIPAGLDHERLPVGIQLIGNDFSEALLLRIARCYEKATSDAPWREEKPQVLRE